MGTPICSEYKNTILFLTIAQADAWANPLTVSRANWAPTRK